MRIAHKPVRSSARLWNSRTSRDGPGVRRLGRAFVDSYRRHMEKEENEFFRAALRLLSPEECADIEAEITDPTDPVFQDKAALRPSELEARIRDYRGLV